MRSVIVSEFYSIDGMMSGVDDSMGWVTTRFGDKATAYELALHTRADTLLLGTTTYNILSTYWPNVPNDPNANPQDKELSHIINGMQKLVVCDEPADLRWTNSAALRDLKTQTILELKSGPGKDILVVGSSTVVQALASDGLIDEYHFMLHPVLLGRGKPLFRNLNKEICLELASVEQFDGGVLLLRYRKA